ncbi:ATP-binding protein [Blastococcus sp. CCUG 61487]|uniref:ATP-binding protein n=1 Tax=Blastococcus sp. CCUG 61487 TaxID=1840703 RepID=UPI0010BFE4CE|nr:ATP-binding protein [Blastococcus sp. CCUG 61487]TKJ30088.1 histidine kinase [Blastococcus sp. CCUG 61487]
MTGQLDGHTWPSAPPPRATPVLRWELRDIAELPGMRSEVRRSVAAHGVDDDVLDQLVLALDEMASNALRHGGGRVEASLQVTADAYLVEVSDSAAARPPTPAVDRDPSQGGLGLYLIARMARLHGWYASGGAKHVWALLPRS